MPLGIHAGAVAASLTPPLWLLAENERRLAALRDAGLDHIQLSFQASSQELNDYLSRARTFDLKRQLGRSRPAGTARPRRCYSVHRRTPGCRGTYPQWSCLSGLGRGKRA
jgi:hypothetical protein